MAMSRAAARGHREAGPVETPAPTAAALVEALLTTAHAIQRFADARIPDYKLPMKLSGSRLRVLLAVDDAGSLRMGDLATDLGVAARTVTDLVDGLEKAGLLARKPDPSDRRATLLELSPTARVHFERVQAMQRALSDEVLAPLDADERLLLFSLLTRLKQGPIRDAAKRPWECDDG